MPRKKSAKSARDSLSPLDGAAQYQEAVEVATTRRQEAEKECRVQYRALLQQCTLLQKDQQRFCVQEATEAYRESLSACQMRYEADLRAARVLLEVHLGQESSGKRRK